MRFSASGYPPAAIRSAKAQRPQGDDLDPSGERVLDFAVGEDVGRARQQKLARRLVGVDGPLDREQQIGAGPLDLVEQDRAREAGHESLGVAARRIPRRSVVKAEHVSEVLARRDLSRQGALAHLPGAHHVDDAGIGQCFQDRLATVSGEVGGHSYERSANWESQLCNLGDHSREYGKSIGDKWEGKRMASAVRPGDRPPSALLGI